ncbi:MAG: ABC transporter ATP-binding protein [Candidatus Rokubacteria bacterium]|nr:ABC transporter ATP-binding protein [Candidatus Rokubacteria bacterium]
MSDAAPAGVVVGDLEKVYVDPRTAEEVVAIRGLDLTIEPNEFVSIIGPSGCGKTTFLHMLAGLRKATGGRMLVHGKPITRPGADRGMVFQDYALLPWKTARENVEFGLKIKGLPAAERTATADRYLRQVGLDGFQNKYPRELSGGMQQRVALARALANTPEILLMDEPFASVDALTRISLQELLMQLWESEPRTIVFVTHSVEEAVFLSSKVAVFSARPGRCARIVPIDLPRPRRWAALQAHPRTAELRQELLALVQGGIAAPVGVA